MNDTTKLHGLRPGDCYHGGLTILTWAAVVTVLTATTVNFTQTQTMNAVIDNLCFDVAVRCITVLCLPLSCATLRPLTNMATTAPPCAR